MRPSNYWVVGLVNYHSSDDTSRCVESLNVAADGRRRVDVVVVDNSSGFVPIDDQVVRVIRPGRNIGYAAAVNLVITEAKRSGADYLWVLNNDCVVRPDAFEKYELAAMTHSGYDIYTSLVELGETGTLWYGGGELCEWSGVRRHSGYGVPTRRFAVGSSRVSPTRWASGANIVVRVPDLARLGYWNEHFFLYLEELEWQLRNGTRAGVVRVPLVKHYAGSSTGGGSGVVEPTFTSRNYIMLATNQRGLRRIGWLTGWLVESILKPALKLNFRHLVAGLVGAGLVATPGATVLSVAKCVLTRWMR